jgi:hypothetical protein
MAGISKTCSTTLVSPGLIDALTILMHRQSETRPTACRFDGLSSGISPVQDGSTKTRELTDRELPPFDVGEME